LHAGDQETIKRTTKRLARHYTDRIAILGKVFRTHDHGFISSGGQELLGRLRQRAVRRLGVRIGCGDGG